MPCQPWHYADDVFFEVERPFGLMGILNLTPDSFYDGGKYTNCAAAFRRARKLLDDGADIIDIGAESTRPGAVLIDSAVEIGRLSPVVRELRAQLPDAMISVDTWKAGTAVWALANGAVCINDVSGALWDEALIDVLAEYKPAYVLMHSNGRPDVMQKNPRYENIVAQVQDFFDKRLAILVNAGLPENRIALDPGFGFGKTFDHNRQLLENIDALASFGRPVLAGISMKSMTGAIASREGIDRESATAQASVKAWLGGAFWHRVHHPASTARALNAAICEAEDKQEAFSAGVI